MLAQPSTRYYAPAAVAVRPAAERPVVVLTVVSLAAAFVALISFMQAVKAQAGDSQFYYYSTIAKSPVYYAAHAVEILALLAAGLLALRSTNTRAIAGGFLVRLALFFAAGLLMAARGYSRADLFSTKLVDTTGPFVCLISVAIFIGARRANWQVIDKVLVAFAGVLSALALYGMSGLQTTSRQEAVANLNPAINALFWFAAWTALRESAPRSLGRRLRFIPIAIYGLASVFTQTRLNFVMLFALLGMCAYVDYRRGLRQAVRWAALAGIAIWLALFVLVFLSDTGAFTKIQSASEAFYTRLDQDTRSGQLRWFFNVVAPHELLLGRGSLATWQWGTTPWGGGTDIGYLTLLFYGGVPLLLTYIAVHFAPAIGVLRRKPSSLQLAAAGVVLLWALRMCSSSYPGLALDYYPILMCVGACISREREA